MTPFRSLAAIVVALTGAACATESPYKPAYEDSVRAEIPESYYGDDTSAAIPPSARERRSADEDPRADIESRIARERSRRGTRPDAGYPYDRAAPGSGRSRAEARIAEERQRREDAFGWQPPGEARRLEMPGGPELDYIPRGEKRRATDDTATSARASSPRSEPQPRSRERTVRYSEPSRGDRSRAQPVEDVPGEAPPLPEDARPGQCFMLVEQPAQYRTVTREVREPPRYRTVEERVVDEPGGVEWREDCGPLEDVRGGTGETACLVRTPPRYRTVTRRVREEGRTRLVEERERVRGPSHEWREILCRASLTPSLIRELQRTLEREGYDPGPVDGVFGPKTRSAVNAYQRDHGLPIDDKLNMATLRHLDVMPQ